MKLCQYNTELLEENLTILVKETEYDYSVENVFFECFTTSEKIVNMLNCLLKLNKKAEEYVYMVAFNNAMVPLGIFEISHGAVDCSIIRPREVYIRALFCGASRIVILHNHPGGNLNPSEEDEIIYRRISKAGDLIGVDLIDFIIVGRNSYYSFTEER